MHGAVASSPHKRLKTTASPSSSLVATTRVRLTLRVGAGGLVAAGLVAETRTVLRPLIRARHGERGAEREADVQPEQTFARGLAAWEPLLYRPAYEPRPLAQNLCLEPAISATLDQCGSL